MITPEDDLFHPRNEDPSWNESAFFTFCLPERDLSGLIYFYHRPNLGISAGGPIIWDATGEEIYNCLYWDWDTCQQMPADAQMYDFVLPNTLALTTLELGERYRATYSRHDCELELTWESLVPAHEMRRISGETNPSLPGWWSDKGVQQGSATGHYDQVGRVHGSISVEGETFAIDCFANRDRTWGPRHVPRNHVGYSWGVVDADHSFHAPSRSFLPIDQDPIIGTTETVTAGWYLRDGVTGELESGERRVERGHDGRPVREIIDAVDSKGRDLHVEGRPVNLLKWTGYTETLDWVSLTRWDLDGETAWGEIHDYYDFRTHRRVHTRLSERDDAKVAR